MEVLLIIIILLFAGILVTSVFWGRNNARILNEIANSLIEFREKIDEKKVRMQKISEHDMFRSTVHKNIIHSLLGLMSEIEDDLKNVDKIIDELDQNGWIDVEEVVEIEDLIMDKEINGKT